MPTITKAVAFWDSNGMPHRSVEEAQLAELIKLINTTDGSSRILSEDVQILAKGILEEKEAYLTILTMGPKSRPKARRVGSTTNPKRAAKRASTPPPTNGVNDGDVTVYIPEPTPSPA